MPKQTIAIIVTIGSVGKTARKLVAERGGGIRVYQCYWGNAVQVARNLHAKGIKTIISMGLASQVIRGSLTIPVIEIPYSSLECLAAVEKAYAVSEKVVVLGSEDIRHQMRRVAAHTGKQFPIVSLEPDKTAEEQVKRLVEEGYEVVISGSPCSDIARRLGVFGVNLEIDERTIARAIDSARRFEALMNETEEKTETIKAILTNTSEGLLCTDREDRVSYANPAVGEMLGAREGILPGRDASALLRGVGSGEIITGGDGPDHGSGLIVTSKTPIRVDGKNIGSVYAISKVSEIQKLEQYIRRELLRKGHFARSTFADIIGDSVEIQKTIRTARKYALYDSTVLIMGESGTGKELFAQSIHNASKRKNEAFVAVNCAALPEHLLESELFGYVKGAFSGARSEGKTGLFELAHNGTIFLDEIGELPLAMQAKLLRVLQEGEFSRIGGDRVVAIDTRVLCATNKNLFKLVEKGEFREDLYYRLHVLELRLPPLRERSADIGKLAKALLLQKNKKLGTGVARLAPQLERRLTRMAWKGNVRQLSNMLERMMVLCETDCLDVELLETVIERMEPSEIAVPGADGALLRRSETQLIQEALAQTKGNRKEAARLLGIGTTTLWRKLKNERNERPA